MAKRTVDMSRRRVAAGLVLLPAALIGLAGQARAQACYDPATLPMTQRSRRRSLGYTEPSPDPAKKCGICAFFTAAGTGAGCGTCQMLTGGTVDAGAVCNSWAKKP